MIDGFFEVSKRLHRNQNNKDEEDSCLNNHDKFKTFM